MLCLKRASKLYHFKSKFHNLKSHFVMKLCKRFSVGSCRKFFLSKGQKPPWVKDSKKSPHPSPTLFIGLNPAPYFLFSWQKSLLPGNIFAGRQHSRRNFFLLSERLTGSQKMGSSYLPFFSLFKPGFNRCKLFFNRYTQISTQFNLVKSKSLFLFT